MKLDPVLYYVIETELYEHVTTQWIPTYVNILVVAARAILGYITSLERCFEQSALQQNRSRNLIVYIHVDFVHVFMWDFKTILYSVPGSE